MHGHGHEPRNGNGHDDHHDPLEPRHVADDRRAARRGLLRSLFARWEALIEAGIRWYVRQLNRAMNYRLDRRADRRRAARGDASAGWGRSLRREFFPEVDSGAFEMYARAASGTRIEETEKRIAKVEEFVRKTIGEDLQIIISELGVVADLSAAYTPNAGPMDAVVKVQLKHEREHSAQEYVEQLAHGAGPRPEVSATWSLRSTPAA